MSTSRNARAAVARLLVELDAGSTRNLDDLIGRVVALRGGRPIALRAADLSGSTPFGSCVPTAEGFVILYPANTAQLHQLHIKLHELGHLALKHDQRATPRTSSATAVLEHLLEVAAQKAAPDLSPELIAKLLGSARAMHRTAYTDQAECEAETFATVIGQAVAHDPGYWKPQDTPARSLHASMWVFRSPASSRSVLRLARG